MVSSSVATKVKQNRSIFYSCPGGAGPAGPAGPPGADGIAGPPGPKGDPGSFTGGLVLSKGANINVTDNTVNNYILVGNNGFYLIVSDNDTPANITGFAMGSLGRVITLINTSSVVQTFIQENEGSAASNRFVLGSSDVLIGVNGTITFLYVTGLTIGESTNQSRWVMTSST